MDENSNSTSIFELLHAAFRELYLSQPRLLCITPRYQVFFSRDEIDLFQHEKQLLRTNHGQKCV